MTKVLKAKIDVTKIDKKRIVTRSYTDKNGQEVTVKEYPVDIILFDVPTHIKDFNDYKLVKSGFMVEGQTKEERERQEKGTPLGDVVEFQSKEVVEGVDYPEAKNEETMSEADLIPF